MVENESKIEAQDLLIDYRSYYCHLLVIDRIRQLGAKFRSRFNVFFFNSDRSPTISKLSKVLEFETF